MRYRDEKDNYGEEMKCQTEGEFLLLFFSFYLQHPIYSVTNSTVWITPHHQLFIQWSITVGASMRHAHRRIFHPYDVIFSICFNLYLFYP
ncbi:hypothetical protein PRUPE_3G100700 [Prunus persica]|uniref:Uncharacterized protein n=1 Tax=Prunus persica TaxID=3760 RepID=A0A251PZD7_PRUPE|nr:hypothetical protein PRUPE_3G100700 [Prunus persica]